MALGINVNRISVAQGKGEDSWKTVCKRHLDALPITWAVHFQGFYWHTCIKILRWLLVLHRCWWNPPAGGKHFMVLKLLPRHSTSHIRILDDSRKLALNLTGYRTKSKQKTICLLGLCQRGVAWVSWVFLCSENSPHEPAWWSCVCKSTLWQSITIILYKKKNFSSNLHSATQTCAEIFHHWSVF